MKELLVSYAFLAAAILFNVAASISFKFSSKFVEITSRHYILLIAGLIVGGVNAVFYTKSLEKIDLGIAYPVFSGGSIILLLLSSLLVFEEHMTVMKGLGALMICIGIYIISR